MLIILKIELAQSRHPSSANQPKVTSIGQGQGLGQIQIQVQSQQQSQASQPSSLMPNDINHIGCNVGQQCLFVCNGYLKNGNMNGCQNINLHQCVDMNGSVAQNIYSWPDNFTQISMDVSNTFYKEQDGKYLYVRQSTDSNNCRSFRFVDMYAVVPESNIEFQGTQEKLLGANAWFTAEDSLRMNVPKSINFIYEYYQQVIQNCGVIYDCFPGGPSTFAGPENPSLFSLSPNQPSPTPVSPPASGKPLYFIDNNFLLSAAEQWIVDKYVSDLCRPADTNGYNHWLSQYNGNNKYDIENAIQAAAQSNGDLCSNNPVECISDRDYVLLRNDASNECVIKCGVNNISGCYSGLYIAQP